MKITLLHPSRGRAKRAFETYQHWINSSSGTVEIQHVMAIDNDDAQNQDYYTTFKDVPTVIVSGDHDCVVRATNSAARYSKGDILVYLSDDFKCPQNWDLEIIKRLQGKAMAILRVNDGGLAHKTNQPVLTIPIMTRALYNELDYFFYNEYKSMWCDVDLYFTTKQYLIEAFDLQFIHEHHSEARSHLYDETYKRSEQNWNQGALIFNKRAKQFGWPKTAEIH